MTLSASAPGSTIDGLEITSFGGSGIVIQSSNNTIGGAAAADGNILVSNTRAGVSIRQGLGAPSDAVNNLLVGNFIGTDATGANRGNGAGIISTTSGNTIGGITAGAANVIGFNTSEGLFLSGAGASGNVVLGNFIGTNPAGANLSNPIGVNVQSPANTIGGTSTGAANILGFATSEGVLLSGDVASGNVVLGNFIGTNAAGANLGNSIGVNIGSGNNTLGGATAAPGTSSASTTQPAFRSPEQERRGTFCSAIS